MGTALEQYLASQKPPIHPEIAPQGFATELMHPYIPVKSMGFIQSLGVSPFNTKWDQLPDPIKIELAKLQPAVQKLGTKFDYGRLAELADKGKDNLPPDIYFKLAGVAAIGQSLQIGSKGRAAEQSMLVAVNEAGRSATLSGLTGAVKPIPPEMLEGADLSAQGVALSKTIGSVFGIAASGQLVYSALSKVSLLPHIGSLVAQIPLRVREATLGIGAMAILDAARPDGLPPDPAGIDVAARIASPISKFFGDSELAQRGALAIGGGITGGAVMGVLGGVFKGIQAGRELRLASKLTPEDITLLKTKLNEAGIGVEKGETSRSIVAKTLRNLDKIGQTEKMAAMTAADETRTDFIMQHLYSDPAFSGPPKLPNTRVVDAQGQPLRVYRGERGPGYKTDVEYFAEEPAHANIYAEQGGLHPTTEVAQRVTPAYLDIKNPIDLTNGNIQPPAKFLDAYEKIAGTREVYSGDVIGSFDDVLEAARKTGYDGIKYVVPPMYMPKATAAGMNLTSWIALNPSKQVIPAFVSDDAKLMAAVFRANPGGLSIAKGVTNLRAADEVVKRLGLNVTAIRAGEDYLIMKPQVSYPVRPVSAKLANQMADFTDYVRASNQGKPTARLAILPDGTVVRGEYTASEMVGRYKIKAPVIEGAVNNDVAFKEHFGLIDAKVIEGGRVQVDLPSMVTQRQVDILGRMADRGIPEMTINSTKPGLSKTITNPFGMQVQDIMADMVQGATRPKISAETMAKVEQYKRTGVFKGQAATLPDGYPVEVQSRYTKTKGQAMIVYKDPLTGSTHRIGEENIAILPTSLEGEFAPSLAFMDAMDPAERAAFATLRRGINEGLAKPIKTVHDLEAFASTRGKLVTSLGKGRVRLYDPNTGEGMAYEDIKSAVRAVRGSVGPLPDLTPPEIEEVLGFKPNIGSVGNGGPPANFGEPVAITADEFDKAATSSTMGQLVPGALEQLFKPTRGLFLDLEKRYGLPFGRVFLNLQEGTVHRQNFAAAWIYGEGPGLPEGVKPLNTIYKMAGGKSANQRAITAWLESESNLAIRTKIESGMNSQEIAAAKELRKWYGVGADQGLFHTLGVESEFLTDYAPHIRQYAGQEGNDITELWRRTRGQALPKAIDFFADYSRDGSLNVYEDRAFVSAAQYINAGGRSRFMNSAMEDAKKLLRAVSDNGVKMPLVNYLEALRGSEFAPQRAALDASFTRFMNNLGASEKVAKDVGEKLTYTLLGLSYSATMGFRFGLPLRNAGQIFQTTWPLLGQMDDTFAEGIGRAMTTAGRDAAIRAGAISIKQNAVFAGEEIQSVMPEVLKKINDLGFKMYDGADHFARAVTFNVAKLRAQKAIEEFAGALRKEEGLATAQRTLIKDSGAMVLDKPIVDDFLRRIATSPENASDFIGKQITDVTQYLYGRGNQPRWMRTVPGRFFGQFGTWPLWWIDYVKRSFLNMVQNGYKMEAFAFLGKLALVDAAIYETGKTVGLDLRRWMSANTLFYTGGPGMEVVRGTIDLIRGTGENFLGTYESPATKQRLAAGAQTLQRVGQAFIPFSYAVKDIARLLHPSNPTEALGAFLGVRPSTDFTVQQRLDMLFNPGRTSTDIDLETNDPNTQTATEIMLKGMNMSNRDRTRLPLPLTGEPLPAQPQGYGASQQGGGASRVKLTLPAGQVRPPGRPPLEPTALPESIRTGESKPNP